MLTTVRQLAGADAIALVHWLDDEIVEIAQVDPPHLPAAAFRAPPAWQTRAPAAVLAEDGARRFLPSVLLHALNAPPAAVCLVHGPSAGTGYRATSLLLVWQARGKVPVQVRENPEFLRHLLVSRTVTASGEHTASAARLDAVMAHVPQGIVFVDDAASQAVVNPVAARWLRVSAGVVTADELTNATQQMLARCRHRDTLRAELRDVLRNPDARIDDWTWELDGPEPATLRVTSVPVDDGERRGRLWTLDDVSHERELLRQLAHQRIIEEKLRQVQKLELVGRLAAGVAHDFNNLLTIIGGSAEMLEDAPLDADRRADLQSIEQATERARRLTRQLLTFTRQQVEQSETFSVDERLRETAPLLTRVLMPSRLRLDLNAPSAQVYADPNQVELALLNLLANARDAMPSGGVATLRTTVERLSGERVEGVPQLLAGAHVAISISDTGTGIDATARARLFEPFFTTKPTGQGTGLGLATVLAIAQRAGGGVRCTSAPGAGATFTVLLPLAGASAPGTLDELPDAAAGVDVASARPCVLLVDDDPGPRNTLRRLLVHEGFDVQVADSAAQALELLERGAPRIHALVTDYMMPQMDGRELLHRVRQRWPNLPAVIMSGYAPDVTTAAMLRTMRAGFIAKPFSGRQLASAIQLQLDAERGDVVNT